MSVIEVDLFPEDVDGPDHPKAVEFQLLLEQVADDNECRLLLFEVEKGTVAFAFDSDELTAQILKVLQENPSDLLD